MRTRRNWFIAGVATVCLITGVALSHLIEPGVRVQKVTLAEETPALILMASTLVLTPALIAGIVIGWFAARRGSRLQGDIAMAIFLGCAPFQCLELPRTALQAPTSHIAIKLDAKLLDACIGEYEFAPDNASFTGIKAK